MIPMKHSTIFKSRWWAMLWAAGIIWFALDIATDGEEPGTANQATASGDATGAPITSDEAKALAGSLGG